MNIFAFFITHSFIAFVTNAENTITQNKMTGVLFD